MPSFTVFGLWIDDEPVVAGVVEGDLNCVDNDPQFFTYQRWATSVEAATPDHAERLAVRDMKGAFDAMFGEPAP